MAQLRSFLRTHRALAALLVALALAMKALVPTGYMVGSQNRTIAAEICDGQNHHVLSQIVVGQTGKAGEGQGEHGKADTTCPYAAALGHASLAGADPVQLALALVFILTLGYAALIPAQPSRAHYLRPPLRGPPSQARPT